MTQRKHDLISRFCGGTEWRLSTKVAQLNLIERGLELDSSADLDRWVDVGGYGVIRWASSNSTCAIDVHSLLRGVPKMEWSSSLLPSQHAVTGLPRETQARGQLRCKGARERESADERDESARLRRE